MIWKKVLLWNVIRCLLKKKSVLRPRDIIRNITAKAMSLLLTSLFPDCVETFHQLERKKNSTNHIPHLLYSLFCFTITRTNPRL